MAGMFYSLKEAAEKLKKTETQIKELAKQGKLREFRDGSNLLFKVDEVEALIPQTEAVVAEVSPTVPKKPKRPRKTKKQEAAQQLEQEPVVVEQPAEPKAETTDLTPDLVGGGEPEEVVEPEKPAEPEVLEELEVSGEPEKPEISAEPSELEAPVEPGGLEEITEEIPEKPESPTQEDEVSLAQETGSASAAALEGDLTEADTALTGEGISVLGEGDKDFELTDDTMAETSAEPGIPEASAEASAEASSETPLEEIEEDVNLDTFGSGSGLLDLSLQADDTSLGGILDEIYTSEGGGEEQKPAPGTAEEVVAEAEQMLPEDVQAEPETVIAPSPVVAQAYVQTAPDTLSKALGVLLFLPLFILIYTAVVAVAGLRGVMPLILSSIQGFIWYILLGSFILMALVVGGSLFAGGKAGASATKREKTKKPPKPKKSKKKGKEAAAPNGASE